MVHDREPGEAVVFGPLRLGFHGFECFRGSGPNSHDGLWMPNFISDLLVAPVISINVSVLSAVPAVAGVAGMAEAAD
jgi:hypothetical protein